MNAQVDGAPFWHIRGPKTVLFEKCPGQAGTARKGESRRHQSADFKEGASGK